MKIDKTISVEKREKEFFSEGVMWIVHSDKSAMIKYLSIEKVLKFIVERSLEFLIRLDELMHMMQ